MKQRPRKYGEYRWEIALAAWVVALVALTWWGMLPLARAQMAHYRQLRADLAFLSREQTIPGEILSAKREALILDSLLVCFEQRKRFDEAQVVEEVYALAESAGCAASKVEIREPVRVTEGREIPIVFNGRGSYEAMGRFADGIENSAYAARVRQLVMKRTDGDDGALYLDFVVMESDQGPTR